MEPISRGPDRATLSFSALFVSLRTFEAVAIAMEQFRNSPLVTVFDFGYADVDRQVKTRGTVTNKLALERNLQLGISEEVTRLNAI